MLIIYCQLNELSKLLMTLLNCYIFCPRDRKLSLVPPFINLKVGKKLCFRYKCSVSFDTHFFASYMEQLILAARRRSGNKQVFRRNLKYRNRSSWALLACSHNEGECNCNKNINSYRQFGLS